MGVNYQSIDEPIQNKLNLLFPDQDLYIKIMPGNFIIPKEYASIGDRILNFKVRPDDVWMISYPRTGSTWAQEMIWLLGNNLDFESSKELQILRSPFLEFSVCFSENEKLREKFGDSIEYLEKHASPRFIKTHVPWHLLPKEIHTVKPKIIYTSRNIKDLAVSYFHCLKLLKGLNDDFNLFCELFITGNIPYGSPLEHLLPFWNNRNQSNILFLKYEDMKRDLPSAIRKCSELLDLQNVLTDDNMNKMLQHLKFDCMQKNPAVNLTPLLDTETKGKFIRKGQIGDWKNYMSTELSAKFDLWIEERLKGTELKFEYE